MIDVRDFGAIPDNSTYCSDAINVALLLDDIYISDGIYKLDKSIKIPSNRTVFGKSAVLRLKDAGFDNIFVNSDPVGGNQNIKIIGKGNFCIDTPAATNYNDSTFPDYGGRGGAGMYKVTQTSLTRVTGFQIENVNSLDRPHYGINLNHCTDGLIKNFGSWLRMITQSQDTISMRAGVNNIRITGLNGNSGDDINSAHLSDQLDCCYLLPNSEWRYGDIHHIQMDDIIIYDGQIGGLCAIIVPSTQYVHDLVFQDIRMIHAGSIFYNYSGYVPVGTVDNCYNLTYNNIRLQSIGNPSRPAPFYFQLPVKDLIATNIVFGGTEPMYLKNPSNLNVQNSSINGITIN